MKKTTEDFSFQLLVYTALFASTPKQNRAENERRKAAEQKESCGKLFEYLSCGTRDILWWRMAMLSDIGSGSLRLLKRSKVCRFDDDNDQLFRSVEARKACQKYRKLAVSKNDEAGLCSLCRFDAVITQAVDIFARCTIGHAEAPVATIPIGSEANGKAGVKKCSRDRTIPQDSAQDLKQLPPISATNLMQCCYTIFRCGAAARGVDIKRDLLTETSGGTNARLKKESSKHTI